jgi:hypothetical protein
MTTYKGKDGRFKVGGVTVANVRSFTFTRTAAITDDSTLEDDWDTHQQTTKSWSGSAQVWWDPADAGQVALEEGDSAAAELYPHGTDAGKTKFTGTCTVTSVQVSNTRDGIVEATIEFTGNGALTKATI